MNHTSIQLSALVIDVDYQPRFMTDSEGDPTPVKRSYISALTKTDPEQWPPIVVSPLPDGRFLVIDGMHRVEAARQLGLESLPALIEDGASYARAFELNMEHGLPLSVSDRKAFARWLAEHAPELSDREIARRCGLSPTTVGAALRESEAANGQSKPHDPQAKAARRLVSGVQDLWQSKSRFDPHRTQTAGQSVAQAALRQWDEDADAMLERLAAIIASAREQLGDEDDER